MPTFDELAKLREAGAEPLLRRLLADLRAGVDPAAHFQGLLLATRVRLGLPAVTCGAADEIPLAQQSAYEDGIRAAGREVGQRLLDQNRLADAWTYFRLIGEPGPVAAALDRYVPDDEGPTPLGEALQIALQEGVNPQRGFDLVLDRHGVCNAITTLSQTLYQPGPARLHAIRRLTQALHGELTERVRADLKQRGVALAADATLPTMVGAVPDLFADDNYHVDLSHLSSVVQFALELPPCEETKRAEELCVYGEGLNPRFQPPSDPPFGDGYAAYRRYFETLNQRNVEANLAYFKEAAAKVKEETTGPGEVLVHLLAALERPEEALVAYREHLAEADPRRLACPSPIVLCQRLGRFDPLLDLAQARGDVVAYAAALLQSIGAAPPRS